jgi:hypothetical protein
MYRSQLEGKRRSLKKGRCVFQGAVLEVYLEGMRKTTSSCSRICYCF